MGFTGADGGPCHACDSNFYKDALGSSNCTKCPANSVSFLESKNLQDCKCAKGHYNGWMGGWREKGSRYGRRDGYKYIYCLPPAGVLHSQNKGINAP
jgi:hypothetical protein